MHHGTNPMFLPVLFGTLAALASTSCASHHGNGGDEHAGDVSGTTHARPTQTEIEKLRSERFTEIDGVDAVPVTCQLAFAEAIREPTFSLANPGAPYQSTDVMSAGVRLPWRRLVFGGMSNDRCVIYYEIGGFAHRYAALIFDITPPAPAKCIWGGTDGGIYSSLSELITQISQGSFKRGGDVCN